LSQTFDEEIARNGGLLQVGLYRRESDVRDFDRELRVFIESYTNESVFNEHLGVDRYTLDSLESLREKMALQDTAPNKDLAHSDEPCMPKLHFKTNCLLGPGADDMTRSQAFTDVILEYCRLRLGQLSSDEHALGGVTPALLSPLIRNSDGLIGAYVIGSHNQDRRSMVLDGEAMVYVSGTESVIGALDMVFLMGSVEWINEPSQVDDEFPRTGSIFRALARQIKDWI
jgi:hypothetical protein